MAKKLTIEDLIARKSRLPAESRSVYVPGLDGEITVQKLPLERMLNVMDGLDAASLAAGLAQLDGNAFGEPSGQTAVPQLFVTSSVNLEEGGYFHDDGEYTEETSLVLTLIDADSETVQDIAKDLCAFFRQESVLVTENCISGQFINEAL